MRRRGFAMAVGVQDPPALRRSETCFGKPVGPPPSAKTTEASARQAVAEAFWPSRGKLFREARRASPQRQNNGARACDGAGLPWLSRKLRSENCFGKPDRPAPSAKITERARATARVCHGCRRPRPPRFASLGNLFREARRATPQRQNDGSEREGGCRRSFGRRPENCFGKPVGPAPSAKITERARATARICHGCRGSFGRRPESCFEKPDGPAPSVKITGASASKAVAEASAVAQKVFLGSPTGLTPASKRRERAFGQPDGPDPSPNPRRFFASRKMARDAPGLGFCEP